MGRTDSTVMRLATRFAEKWGGVVSDSGDGGCAVVKGDYSVLITPELNCVAHFIQQLPIAERCQLTDAWAAAIEGGKWQSHPSRKPLDDFLAYVDSLEKRIHELEAQCDRLTDTKDDLIEMLHNLEVPTADIEFVRNLRLELEKAQRARIGELLESMAVSYVTPLDRVFSETVEYRVGLQDYCESDNKTVRIHTRYLTLGFDDVWNMILCLYYAHMEYERR